MAIPLNKIHNPFINALHVPFTEAIKAIKYVEGEPAIDSFTYECEPYYRVYNSKPKREFIFSLSMWARDMFTAIQYFTQANNKHVILTYEKMKQLYSVSDPKYGVRRYDETIRELVRHTLIDYKDKEKGEYWYNPLYFASGNRLKMYEECAIKINTIRLNQ